MNSGKSMNLLKIKRIRIDNHGILAVTSNK